MDRWTDWKTDKVTNHIIGIIMIKINWWIVKCIICHFLNSALPFTIEFTTYNQINEWLLIKNLSIFEFNLNFNLNLKYMYNHRNQNKCKLLV